jgi:dienelactone hydrolase
MEGGIDCELGPPHARFRAFRCSPEGPPTTFPGLVLIHTARGFGEPERDIARRLSGWGFEVIAPDLYSLGPSPPAPEDIRDLLHLVRDLPFEGSFVPGFEQTVSALPRPDQERLRLAARIPLYAPDPRAIATLRDCVSELVGLPNVDPHRIACLGLSMGGGYAWTLATLDARVRAAVVAYGRPLLPWESLGRLRAPVLAVVAGKEGRLTSQLPEWQEEMRQRGRSLSVAMFPEAEHGFLDPADRRAFEERTAESAWARIREFLQANVGPLRGPPTPAVAPAPLPPVPQRAGRNVSKTSPSRPPPAATQPVAPTSSPGEVTEEEVEALLSGSGPRPAGAPARSRKKHPASPRKVRKAK